MVFLHLRNRCRAVDRNVRAEMPIEYRVQCVRTLEQREVSGLLQVDAAALRNRSSNELRTTLERVGVLVADEDERARADPLEIRAALNVRRQRLHSIVGQLAPRVSLDNLSQPGPQGRLSGGPLEDVWRRRHPKVRHPRTASARTIQSPQLEVARLRVAIVRSASERRCAEHERDELAGVLDCHLQRHHSSEGQPDQPPNAAMLGKPSYVSGELHQRETRPRGSGASVSWQVDADVLPCWQPPPEIPPHARSERIPVYPENRRTIVRPDVRDDAAADVERAALAHTGTVSMNRLQNSLNSRTGLSSAV
jgi:hypothetical protein